MMMPLDATSGCIFTSAQEHGLSVFSNISGPSFRGEVLLEGASSSPSVHRKW